MPQILEAKVGAEVAVNAVPVHVELRRRAHAGEYVDVAVAHKEGKRIGEEATGVI